MVFDLIVQEEKFCSLRIENQLKSDRANGYLIDRYDTLLAIVFVDVAGDPI